MIYSRRGPFRDAEEKKCAASRSRKMIILLTLGRNMDPVRGPLIGQGVADEVDEAGALEATAVALGIERRPYYYSKT